MQLWKNPVTGGLHFQVHPCGVCELFVDPLPEGAKKEGALYPEGAHITDLGTVRDILYKMQRPAIVTRSIPGLVRESSYDSIFRFRQATAAAVRRTGLIDGQA